MNFSDDAGLQVPVQARVDCMWVMGLELNRDNQLRNINLTGDIQLFTETGKKIFFLQKVLLRAPPPSPPKRDSPLAPLPSPPRIKKIATVFFIYSPPGRSAVENSQRNDENRSEIRQEEGLEPIFAGGRSRPLPVERPPAEFGAEKEPLGVEFGGAGGGDASEPGAGAAFGA